MNSESTHHEKIRERFTETADVFAQTVRRTRGEEAEELATRCLLYTSPSPRDS